MLYTICTWWFLIGIITLHLYFILYYFDHRMRWAVTEYLTGYGTISELSNGVLLGPIFTLSVVVIFIENFTNPEK